MSQERALLLMIKGTIAEMPEEDQAKVNAAADAIRKLVADNGDYGLCALGLVGAEAAAEQ